MYNSWNKNLQPSIQKYHAKIESRLRQLASAVKLSFLVVDPRNIIKKMSAPQAFIDKIWKEYKLA